MTATQIKDLLWHIEDRMSSLKIPYLTTRAWEIHGTTEDKIKYYILKTKRFLRIKNITLTGEDGLSYLIVFEDKDGLRHQDRIYTKKGIMLKRKNNRSGWRIKTNKIFI